LELAQTSQIKAGIGIFLANVALSLAANLILFFSEKENLAAVLMELKGLNMD